MKKNIIITIISFFCSLWCLSCAIAAPLSNNFVSDSTNTIMGYVVNQGKREVYSTSFSGGQHSYVPFDEFNGTAAQYLSNNFYSLSMGTNNLPQFVYVMTGLVNQQDPSNEGCAFIFYPQNAYADYFVLAAPIGSYVSCRVEFPRGATGFTKQNILIVNVTS